VFDYFIHSLYTKYQALLIHFPPRPVSVLLPINQAAHARCIQIPSFVNIVSVPTNRGNAVPFDVNPTPYNWISSKQY